MCDIPVDVEGIANALIYRNVDRMIDELDDDFYSFFNEDIELTEDSKNKVLCTVEKYLEDKYNDR